MFNSINKRKTAITIFAVVCLIIGSLCSATAVLAAPPSYNYNYWLETVAAPAAYQATTIVKGTHIGVGDFKDPSDLHVTEDQQIYIMDTGNNRVVVTDKNFKLIKVIDSFTNRGQEDHFNAPQGLFVSRNKHLYVADTGNNRIVHLDENGKLVQIVESPQTDLLSSTFVFQPARLVVDNAGRMYVMAIGVFDGFMEFNVDGTFTTFIGANRVYVDPIEYLWKMLSTREQRSQMVQFIPTEFTNLDIDPEGFIYAVNGDRWGDNIKKLNAQGSDILRRNGYFRPGGDINYWNQDGPPRLIDIDVTDSEMYSVLDSKRGRIFTYNGDGFLLYIFGGMGNRVGEFNTPIAIERVDDDFLVLDKALGEITVFKTTEYGRVLNEAVRSYYRGDEQRSAEMFRQAANMNANLEYAYDGIGKSLLRQGEYKEAVEYFRQAMDRTSYSKAYVLYRKEVLRDVFPAIMTGLVIVIAAYVFGKRIMKTRRRKKVVPFE
jgi:hypothetical protein